MVGGITRRAFIGSALGAGVVSLAGSRAAEAMEPLTRTSGSRLKLSCAAYSFRDQLTGKDEANPMTLADYIELCARSECDAVEPTSYYFPDPVTDQFLAELKHMSFVRGLDVSGTAIRSDYCVPDGPKRQEQIDHTQRWIDHAVTMGAPCIRVFAGGNAAGDVPAQRKMCVETLKPCLEYASQKGVFLAVENHGGIVHDGDNLLALIEMIDSPWIGINLDTGNFRTANPYDDIRRCAPYSVTVQVKTEVAPGGGAKVEANLPRILSILRESGYRGYVALEYEAAEPAPLAVPRILGRMRRLIDSMQ